MLFRSTKTNTKLFPTIQVFILFFEHIYPCVFAQAFLRAICYMRVRGPRVPPLLQVSRVPLYSRPTGLSKLQSPHYREKMRTKVESMFCLCRIYNQTFQTIRQEYVKNHWAKKARRYYANIKYRVSQKKRPPNQLFAKK